MKLYLTAFKLQFKSLIQYKGSTVLTFISQFFLFFSYYFMIIALFNKFDNIKGFTVCEILLCFSVIQIGYSLAEVFGRGIDQFDDMIISGSFDRLLTKPRNIIFQLLYEKIEFVRIAKTIQAFVILVIALTNLNITWNILKIVTLILMILASTFLFFSIFLCAASYCFFTVQGLEVRNIFTDGGKHMAQYPIGIFKKGIIIFFTFIIPFGFVNYYPLLFFIGRSDNWLYAFSPLIAILFIIPSIFLFNFGVKRYIGTGS